MKHHRRQELQTNELAQILADIRENYSRYGSYILGGLAAIIVIAALAIYISRADAAARDTAVQQIMAARFVNDNGLPLPADQVQSAIDSLQTVADDSSDPDITRRALIKLAGGVLNVCVSQPDAVTAERLQAVENASNRLLRDYGRQPVVAGAALLFLANVEGNRFVLDGGIRHRDKAREYLTRITQNSEKRFDGTPFMQLALTELNNLDETFQTVTLAPPRPPAAAAAEPAGEGQVHLLTEPPLPTDLIPETGIDQTMEVEQPEEPQGSPSPEEPEDSPSPEEPQGGPTR